MSRQVPQLEWEPYREVIKTLYITMDKPLQEVMAYMKDTHGFRATKAQFESQLKKWKLSKNLNNIKWEYVRHRSAKRKREGKESVVHINDVLIPSKKIKKELSRRFPPTFEQKYTSAPSPQTPEGISVHTPAESSSYSIRLENLPWFQFQDELTRIQFNFQNRKHATQRAFKSANSLFVQWFPTTAKPDCIQSIYSNLKADFLERYEGELTLNTQKLVEPVAQDSMLQLLKFAAYLSSNNMLSTSYTDRFLACIINNNMLQALGSLSLINMPSIKVFAAELFWSALRLENTNAVRVFLSLGVDISRYGCEPLMEVSCKGSLELTKILLDAGADVNAPPYSVRDGVGNNMTTLQHAVWKGKDNKFVQMLLEAGADVNAPASDRYGGRTALQAAVECYNIELVQMLLEAGADVNAPANKSNQMALEAAASEGNAEVVRMLLEAGADVNTGCQQTVLQAAASEGNPEVVQMLLEAGADVNAGDWTALHEAASEGNTEVVQMLLEAGADVNSLAGEDDMTALEAAAWKGNIEIVRLLLEAGVDVSALASGRTVLQAAIECHDIELVRMLLEAGADVNTLVNEWEETALQAAVKRNDIELVQMLLEAGADVNAPASDGYYMLTALQAAVKCHDIELVRMLLDAGADVNALSGNCGQTALPAAVLRGNIEIVRMLLGAGADVNAPAGGGYGGLTALQEAVRCHDIELVRILLEAGADVNAPASDRYGGRTALLVATVHGYINLVRILLEAGADVNMDCGRTALQAAAEHGHIELVREFLKAGADVNALTGDTGYRRTALQVAASKVLGRFCPYFTLTEFEAASRVHIELVRILLEAGASANAPASKGKYGRTALQVATSKAIEADIYANIYHKGKVCEAASKYIELVQMLLGAGADVNAPASDEDYGQTALQAAASRGHCQFYEFHSSKILEASWKVHIKLVQMLVEAGADVNAPASKGKYGRTALQGAAERSHIKLVRILLEAGADVNAPASRGDYGRTALQAAIATEKVDSELVQILLDAGADVNAPAGFSRGLTALQGAAIYGHIGIAHMLLKTGVNVNELPACIEGRTALEGAAEHGRLDLVQLLLNAGAGSDAPEDVRYKRAAELAEENRHFVIVEILASYKDS